MVAHEQPAIRIDQRMTRDELKRLRPRWAKSVVLRVEGERHPYQHEYKADEVEHFVGINGEIVFKCN